MADQIVQKLGMDCGDAIASINSLNGAMSKMSGGVANLGNVLASFNSQGKAFCVLPARVCELSLSRG